MKKFITHEERAKRIRLEILSLSDDVLVTWEGSIVSDSFKTVTEHIKETAEAHLKEMPF